MLAIGFLGMLWLLIAGLLLLEIDGGEPARAVVMLDHAATVAEVAHGQETANAEDAYIRYSEPHNGEHRQSVRAVSTDDSADLSDLKIELRGLLRSIQPLLGDSTTDFDPDLEDYMEDLTARINAAGATFGVRFDAPVVADARLAAVRAHAVLVDRGLQPWLLEASGSTGPLDVVVRPVP